MRRFYYDEFNKLTYFNAMQSYQTPAFYEKNLDEFIDSLDSTPVSNGYNLNKRNSNF